jgi:hypothetical protein
MDQRERKCKGTEETLNAEIHIFSLSLLSGLNKSSEMSWERNVALTEQEATNKLLIGKLEWKGPFGRVRNIQEEDNMVKHECMD